MILALLAGSALLIETGAGSTFSVADAPENAEISLHRIVVEEDRLPSVFSTVERKGSRLILRPTYPLSPGETYLARVTVEDELVASLEYRHKPPENQAPPKVIKIYPGTETVPANLLKFYIEFYQPIREGREIFEQIHIVDESGKAVHDPWRRQELWSNNNRRLTLWIHPGRIKQGVNLREELGPVLLPGKHYHLLIDESLQNPAGLKMGTPFRHSFRTTDERRQRIDLAQWKILPPSEKGGSLTIQTNRAIDPFLAERYLRIQREGKLIETTVKADRSQTRFELYHTEGWASGNYTLQVGEFLEDLAGNTTRRVFDTDLSNPDQKPGPESKSFSLDLPE
ncbi:MAG: hypothetical protein P1U89_17215 [Verrucomicrobiales bacterium]|nr:hypothetical protein [Verrucomicrobiales bacterium]